LAKNFFLTKNQSIAHMNLSTRLAALGALGDQLNHLSASELEELTHRAQAENPWFTPDNVQLALAGVAHLLAPVPLAQWAARYHFRAGPPKTVGLVMAGNLPLVGAHDLICGFLSGHHLQLKLSRQDTYLMRQLIGWLGELAPGWLAQVQVVERLERPEAVIATGSDNSSRYFEYYFAKYPHIIRKNRTSVGVLHGHETPDQLRALGQDVLQYFGLGCRSVSKLLVPQGYDLGQFYDAIADRAQAVGSHYKYHNNHDYNLSIYLVNGTPHLDNGTLILKEDPALVSPISVLYYEYYAGEADLAQKLAAHAEKIQCIVADPARFPLWTSFGEAQRPGIGDYADGVDTLQFLLSLYEPSPLAS
jgi:hypothetical protein